MKAKKPTSNEELIYIVFAAWLVAIGISFSKVSSSVFAVNLLIFLIALITCIILSYLDRKRKLNMQGTIARKLSPTDRESLENFPMPCLVTDKDFNLKWFNSKAEAMLCDNDGNICQLDGVSKGIVLDFEGQSQTINATVSNVCYSIYIRKLEINSQELFALYFHNDDMLKRINVEYRLTRPAVMIIEIDNFDEMLKEMRDLERTQIVAMVEEVIFKWIKSSSGILSRYSRDKYMVVLEERDLKKYIDDKFSVLEEIHNIETKGTISPTVSIGIGRGCKSLSLAEMSAEEALDMALGRGGDQAVIKTDNNYEFFGGTLKGRERSSRVRSRIVAASVRNMICDSANVLIMGHKMSDLDCVGAAVGLHFAVNALGREAKIVLDRENTMALELVDSIISSGMDVFISPQQAKRVISKDTLLIIVDTHRKEMMEAPELCDIVNNILVIDHHRKTVDHIQNTSLMYHEPNASSTCEMVVELIQYLDCGNPSKAQSEALLSGIMLDTKNFSNQTGVRTFEAAAYLKRRGADTVSVKHLFSNTYETYRKKAQLLANTVTYRGTAIAIWGDKYDESLRLVAAQAADELLSVKGVIASFTVFSAPDSVIVSARSAGNLNVQLVAEVLGGGGHHTMSGAQMKDISLEKGVSLLKSAIDKVIDDSQN